MIGVLQGIIATATPWVVAHLIAPGEPLWSAIALVVPVAYALLHARDVLAWLAPVSGLLSVLPWIPAWASGIAGVVVAVTLVAWPSRQVDSPRGQSVNAARGAVGGVLVVLGLAIGLLVFLQTRQQDTQFEAGQQQAEAAWSALPSDNELAGATATATAPGLVGAPSEMPVDAAAPVRPPFAKLRFLHRAEGQRVISDRALYVGPDVSSRGLAAGPGHYPGTAKPGKAGNVAIAGHRTGWGSPFRDLDKVEIGDRIRLIDRKGVRHTYVVDAIEVVDPDDSWVLGDDPLGTGKPTLTLTTCDPPGVNTKRLIVFATLKASKPADV